MKNEISIDEYKRKLIEMFSYLDKKCRENNINYSLHNGSLIGCVREKGIIPWDDDIDVSIPCNEIERLTEIINTDDNSCYRIVSYNNNKTYYYPFPKLIDTRTYVIENNQKEIIDYGIYIDLFQYNKMPNNSFFRNIYFYKMKYYKQLFCGYAQINTNNYLKKIRNYYANFIGLERIMKKYKKLTEKYNNRQSDYVIINWPVYKKNNEIQKYSDIIKFSNSIFENINAMIFSNYDSILSNTFGNYMIPPSKEKQITHHNIKAYNLN